MIVLTKGNFWSFQEAMFLSRTGKVVWQVYVGDSTGVALWNWFH